MGACPSEIGGRGWGGEICEGWGSSWGGVEENITGAFELYSGQ